MFLPKDQWSPRFDATFFSVSIEGYERRSEQPLVEPPVASSVPAVYYKLVVYREHQQTIQWRRFSQFVWLHHQLSTIADLPSLPPKTCPWQPIDDAFLQNRQSELSDYLVDLLAVPGVATHPSLQIFLQLL